MINFTVDVTKHGSTDATTFIGLLAAHGQSLYRFIYTLLPDIDQAQDVYQECAMTLWEKFGSYRADEPFLPWAYRIAHFKVLSHRKKNRRRPIQLDADVLDILAEVQVEDNERYEARLRALPGCLDRLKQNERHLLELRYDAGATVIQIAEETNCRAESLYRALHRVRKKLLHCIQKRLGMEEAV